MHCTYARLEVIGLLPGAELPGSDRGGRHHPEVGLDHEVADLLLAPAHDRHRKRLHPDDADDGAGTAGKGDGRGAGQGQRQLVDLVRLSPGDGGLVEGEVVAVPPGMVVGVADGVGVLGGEHHPVHLTAVASAYLYEVGSRALGVQSQGVVTP